MNVQQIPLAEIEVDFNFNSRGEVTKFDVESLMKSITETGLQTPVSVMRLKQPTAQGHKYKLLMGFRRTTAHKYLERASIEARIVEEMSESEALKQNLIENLERQDLTVSQEAQSVKRLRDLGFSMTKICATLRRTELWVVSRLEASKIHQSLWPYLDLNQISLRQMSGLTSMTYSQQDALLRRVDSAHKQLEGKTYKTRAHQKLEELKPPRTPTKRQIEAMANALYYTFGQDVRASLLGWTLGLNSTELIVRQIVADARESQKVIKLGEKNVLQEFFDQVQQSS